MYITENVNLLDKNKQTKKNCPLSHVPLAQNYEFLRQEIKYQGVLLLLL